LPDLILSNALQQFLDLISVFAIDLDGPGWSGVGRTLSPEKEWNTSPDFLSADDVTAGISNISSRIELDNIDDRRAQLIMRIYSLDRVRDSAQDQQHNHTRRSTKWISMTREHEVKLLTNHYQAEP
jgi:hypothetical protein